MGKLKEILARADGMKLAVLAVFAGLCLLLIPSRADKRDTAELSEQAQMQQSALNGDMTVYRHEGFWQCMDTGREYELLNRLWKDGTAPWTRFWK